MRLSVDSIMRRGCRHHRLAGDKNKTATTAASAAVVLVNHHRRQHRAPPLITALDSRHHHSSSSDRPPPPWRGRSAFNRNTGVRWQRRSATAAALLAENKQTATASTTGDGKRRQDTATATSGRRQQQQNTVAAIAFAAIVNRKRRHHRGCLSRSVVRLASRDDHHHHRRCGFGGVVVLWLSRGSATTTVANLGFGGAVAFGGLNRTPPPLPITASVVRWFAVTTRSAIGLVVRPCLITLDTITLITVLHIIPSEADKTVTPHKDYAQWFHQDKLMFGALVGSLSLEIVPLITNASSSYEAWKILADTYASPSRDQTVTNYMQNVKTIVDELAILGKKLDQEDITDTVINGLDQSTYKPILDVVHARDSPISFNELHEKLINQELALAQQVTASGIHQLASVFYAQN
ncbi:hypothetical protein OSB04_017142 [Centaurea solstitialis]|uniref:Uncharacterized protein n=1 Tax=Centaurea solstitialis TaxID=347529 RepID=A0AA38WAF9_9ASTR|nr:hypothetical protein OSB04_017142 [Centaurea solstitialis]